MFHIPKETKDNGFAAIHGAQNQMPGGCTNLGHPYPTIRLWISVMHLLRCCFPGWFHPLAIRAPRRIKIHKDWKHEMHTGSATTIRLLRLTTTEVTWGHKYEYLLVGTSISCISILWYLMDTFIDSFFISQSFRSSGTPKFAVGLTYRVTLKGPLKCVPIQWKCDINISRVHLQFTNNSKRGWSALQTHDTGQNIHSSSSQWATSEENQKY